MHVFDVHVTAGHGHGSVCSKQNIGLVLKAMGTKSDSQKPPAFAAKCQVLSTLSRKSQSIGCTVKSKYKQVVLLIKR